MPTTTKWYHDAWSCLGRCGPGGGLGRWPMTLWMGLILILVCEVFLFLDVRTRAWVVLPLPKSQQLLEPNDHLATLIRSVAIHMTPLCWVGYLLVMDGLLTTLAWRRRDRSISCIRSRPNRFLVAWLTSIPVWCFFDWVNFTVMDAWQYHGLPDLWWQRCVGYFVAFAAISPGMFMAAELYQLLGLRRLQTTGGLQIGLMGQIGCLILGLLLLVYPFVAGTPIGTLTLWVCLVFVLDPINLWLGAPSLIADWRAGHWGRTVSLMASGATCGLLWEFWNYWAVAKWTYHLPFLGGLEGYRVFEMPAIGLLGFLPFALETWVALNTILALLHRLGLAMAEPLPRMDAVI